MLITIDTEKDSAEQVRAVVNALFESSETFAAPPAAKKAPAKKAAAAKKAAEPKPEVEAEPAEDFEVLREKAVSAARDLLDAGEREKVMTALKDLEVGRVSDLPDDSLEAFLSAIA